MKGVDLDVPAGTIFGFLGPNGAGKTTTIEMLCGVQRPDPGAEICVAGIDLIENPQEAKRQVTSVTAESFLFEKVSVFEFLRTYARLFGIPRDEAADRAGELLKLFGLEDKSDHFTDSLSLGQRQKCALAAALSPDPHVLFLDEPTAPLDPAATKMLGELLEDFANHGRTVFLTTHYLRQVQDLCEDIAIINDGKVQERGSLSHLRSIANAAPTENLDEVFIRLTNTRMPYEKVSFWQDRNSSASEEEDCQRSTADDEVHEVSEEDTQEH